MVRWSVAVASLALAVLLASCSDARPTEEVRAGGSTAPGSVPTTTIPAVGSGGSDGSAGVTDPAPVDTAPPVTGGTQPPPPEDTQPATSLPGDRHPQPWDGYTVGPDGRTLTFTYYAGVEPCSVFDSIVADEGPDSVQVTVYEHSGPAGVVCIMMAQHKSASVTLNAPLGARTLVDGAAAR